MEQSPEHLIKLIAWHDNDWNGKRCLNPEENKYCEQGGAHIKEKKKKKCIIEKGKNYLPCGWEISAFEEDRWHVGGGWRLDNHKVVPGQSLVFLLTKYKGGYYLVGIYLVKEKKEKDGEQSIYADVKNSLKLGKNHKLGPYPKQTAILGVTVKKFGQGRTYAYIDNKTAIKLMEKITQKLESLKSPLIDKAKKLKEITEGGSLERFSEYNIDKLIGAISAKPFIILSGISGTGKTQIARIISAGLVDKSED